MNLNLKRKRQNTLVFYTRVFIEFYVLNNEKSPPILPPLPIAKQLQKKISQSQNVFHFDVEFVDTVGMGLVSSPSFFLSIFRTLVCQETCSGHGKCNVTTKRCVCDSFWVENPFKANFGMKETNCGEITETKRYPIRFPAFFPHRLESRLCRRSRRRSWSHTLGCSVGLHLSLARVRLYRLLIIRVCTIFR